MKNKTLHPITTALLSGLFFCFAPVASVTVKAGQVWEEMGAYTTYYNVEDKGRCENIEIASALIDGITLQA